MTKTLNRKTLTRIRSAHLQRHFEKYTGMPAACSGSSYFKEVINVVLLTEDDEIYMTIICTG